MGQFIQFGQSASSVSISRVDIAVGYTGYCIPLDNNTLAKNIVYVRGFGNLELDSQSMVDRKSTRLNSSHPTTSRMPSSA